MADATNQARTGIRTGYLGGTFDPVHLGHLVLAEACLDGAALDRVLLVVSAAPPHKHRRDLTAVDDRLAMARRAIADNPRLFVDDRETRRPGPSFTIETVRELLASKGAEDEIFWIIGSDTLFELPTWKDAGDLLDLVSFVTATRPGFDVESALSGLRAPLGEARVRRLRALIVPMPSIGVSSTDLRRRVADGRTIRYLVPEPVAAYIRTRGLYSTV